MVKIESLSKSFGSTLAVDGISIEVSAGEIYGLLGPNGAGKTTTISCISGLLKPDGGRIVIDGIDVGIDPIRARGSLGVVPQETAIYETLNARENVAYFASLHGLGGAEGGRRVDEALDRVGLSTNAKQQSRNFSGGMKRRLNLAIGIVSRPRLLLLDEPTVGIDPQARIRILDVVRELQKEGTAILYTTHYLEEAEKLCDRVGIMDHGKVLAEGKIAELRRLVGEGTIVTLRGRFKAERFREVISGKENIALVSVEEGIGMISVTGEQHTASELLTSILRSDIEINDIAMQVPSLQSVFLKLTGRELRD